MNWHRRDPYYLQAGCRMPDCRHGTRCGDPACGRYTVSRSWQHLHKSWAYTGWHLAPISPATGRRTGHAVYLKVGDKQDALAACEQHAAQNLERAV